MSVRTLAEKPTVVRQMVAVANPSRQRSMRMTCEFMVSEKGWSMTEPLYQQDAYLTAFDAGHRGRAGRCRPRPGAFFPGGGGQPPDTGVLEVRGSSCR